MARASQHRFPAGVCIPFYHRHEFTELIRRDNDLEREYLYTLGVWAVKLQSDPRCCPVGTKDPAAAQDPRSGNNKGKELVTNIKKKHESLCLSAIHSTPNHTGKQKSTVGKVQPCANKHRPTGCWPLAKDPEASYQSYLVGCGSRSARQAVVPMASRLRTTPHQRPLGVLISSASGIWRPKLGETHVVCGLLVLVPLLVSGGLGLVRRPLLLAQGLPALSEKLADLAWSIS